MARHRRFATAGIDPQVLLSDRNTTIAISSDNNASDVFHPAISPDGRLVTFLSPADTIDIHNPSGAPSPPTPSHTPGVSQAGDRWPRTGAVGHTGFTGTSLWLDLPHRRWVALLTNRVHPTRFGTTADRIKTLRRAVHDAVVDAL